MKRQMNNPISIYVTIYCYFIKGCSISWNYEELDENPRDSILDEQLESILERIHIDIEESHDGYLWSNKKFTSDPPILINPANILYVKGTHDQQKSST